MAKKTGINNKNFTQVHRKVGLFFMPFLLVVVITGAWSLFRAELTQWQFPQFDVGSSTFDQQAENSVAKRKSLDELVSIARDQHGFVYSDFSIYDKERFGHFLLFFNKTNGVENFLFIDPVSGEKITANDAMLSETVYDLHLKLLLPSTLGKLVIGILGLLLTYLVFTGFLAHKNIAKNFYQLRLNKGRQIFTTDVHKLLGNWSLLFSSIMAITGALLGLFSIVLIVLAITAYGGDLKLLYADFLGTQPEPIGQTVSFLSLDHLYQQALQQWESYKISGIEIHNYADPMMRVTFEGELLNGFLTQQHITYDAINGATTFITDFTQKGAGGYLYSVLPSIHFASFGGVWLKLIYWFLTLVLLLIMVTGITIKALRMRDETFSLSDQIVVNISQGIILASSISVLFAIVVTEIVNPGAYVTLAIITIVSVAYAFVANQFLNNQQSLNAINVAAYVLFIASIILLIGRQFLPMMLCLTLGLMWFSSQKIANTVERKKGE